jgi:hypothetical protein
MPQAELPKPCRGDGVTAGSSGSLSDAAALLSRARQSLREGAVSAAGSQAAEAQAIVADIAKRLDAPATELLKEGATYTLVLLAEPIGEEVEQEQPGAAAAGGGGGGILGTASLTFAPGASLASFTAGGATSRAAKAAAQPAEPPLWGEVWVPASPAASARSASRRQSRAASRRSTKRPGTVSSVATGGAGGGDEVPGGVPAVGVAFGSDHAPVSLSFTLPEGVVSGEAIPTAAERRAAE